jgi:hypothetical protein
MTKIPLIIIIKILKLFKKSKNAGERAGGKL